MDLNLLWRWTSTYQNLKGWPSQKCELQSFVFQKVPIWQRLLANQLGQFEYNFRYLKWFFRKLPQKLRSAFCCLFVLTLASERGVLYGNDVLSILAVSAKKWYSSFLKKVFFFQKICFKVKVLKMFETFTDCDIKTCRSLKRKAILKIPSIVF